MSYLFSKQDPTEVATRTACSKLSNNAALMVSELAREPAQGLMHVVVSVSVTHSKFFWERDAPPFSPVVAPEQLSLPHTLLAVLPTQTTFVVY
jgi:hypothetical protein